ncbi:MAG: hypothetical protein OXL96_12855 [Candidatus Poribacteria bacterium]|nr:hypothetical protein [Candidatus Poribacteria bacterium]
MRRKPKNRRGRQDRFRRDASTQDTPTKLPLATVWNAQDEEAAGHRACPLFRAATVLQLPTRGPCWMWHRDAKGCAMFSLNTRISVFHRSIAFRFWASFRSVSFWWQDTYPLRDTGCAEGKRMYLTSKNQNASTVRKVLAGLRVHRNEGDGEMW